MASWFYIWITVGIVVFPNNVGGIAPKGHPKETKTKSVEKQLMRKLLDGYERYGVIGRPVNDSKEQVTVRYGLQMFQILNLDESKQILHTNCWSMYTWNDSLLKWDPKEHGNITAVRIFPSQIWTPEIRLYNFADERLEEQRVARVVVEHDGSTLWVPQALFKSTCEVKITFFPFDTQTCMLEFGSWTYDKSQMEIDWWLVDNVPRPYIDFSDYVKSNEWQTDGEEPVNQENKTIQIRSVKKYRCRNQTAGNESVTRYYPVLRYLVKLRRNPSFYMFMLVIPCVLLSSLTLVVFWLPPESPAKMMLGMNIFVAFFILLLLLAKSTPSAASEFPILGTFFCLNMTMITLSTFLATLVIHLYFRGDRNGTVPACLRRIVIDGIGRLLLVRQYIPLPEVKKTNTSKSVGSSANRRLKTQKHDLLGNKHGPNAMHYHMDNPIGGFYASGYPYPAGPLNPLDPSELAFNKAQRALAGQKYATNPDFFPGGYGIPGYAATTFPGPQESRRQSGPTQPDSSANPINSTVESPELLDSTVTLERDVREVKRNVKMFVNRQKEARRKSLVAMEWRTLAIVLDRLFFYLYITTIGIAVLSIVKNDEQPLPEGFRHTEGVACVPYLN